MRKDISHLGSLCQRFQAKLTMTFKLYKEQPICVIK